MSSGRRLVDLA
eukprot:NP_001348680.2 Uncharacterized protein CELE_F53F10.2 [Caenorhabditis elegans]